MERITQRVIEAAKKVKIIAKHGVGVDNIDVKAATIKGIVISSAVGANSDAVADLTIGLMLSLARDIPFADRSVKEGKWPQIVGSQVNNKVLGIIGLGQIGKKVAKRAFGFDMRILAYDILKDEAFAKEWGITYLTLDEVILGSDFLTIHLSLSPYTFRLIGERELGLMKEGAFLVNISRGDIVDEEALYQVLKNKRIKSAALDLFCEEPPSKGNALLTLDNVITTPHMGGYTFEALNETGMICVRDIINALEGKRPKFIVNPEVLNKFSI